MLQLRHDGEGERLFFSYFPAIKIQGEEVREGNRVLQKDLFKSFLLKDEVMNYLQLDAASFKKEGKA